MKNVSTASSIMLAIAMTIPTFSTVKAADVSIQDISQACSGPVLKNEVVGGRGTLGSSGYDFEITPDKKFNLYQSGRLISSKDFTYQEYTECLKTLSQMILTVMPAPSTPQPATVTYKVCSGEYEQRCQDHDVYQYCYFDVKGWAAERCDKYSVQRLATYGGNKCGYAIDAVICTGPR